MGASTQRAIRHRTSQQWSAKREKLKDFVVPQHIDDRPYGDVTIEITCINTVPFARSWGAGLAKL
jgi:hypothetical protein